MINDIMVMIASAYAHCVDWLALIFLATETAGIYLGCVAVFLTYKFLLAPLFGSHQSDTARNRHKESRNE